MKVLSDGRTSFVRTVFEVVYMYLKRSVVIGFLAGMLISGACTSAQSTDKEPAVKNTTGHDSEMVEIKIRMPDGRVIVRKERKTPSRRDADHPILTGETPKQVNVASKSGSGDVNSTGTGVSGGGGGGGLPSSGSSGGASGGGGGSSGGGGGGGARAGHSGGGTGTGTANNTQGNGTSSDQETGIIPVQPDNDYTVRMYTWDNTGPRFEHAIEAYVADPRSKTPYMLAQSIANQVRRDDPEKIVIRFWKEFDPATRDPFDYTNPTDLFTRGGFDDGIKEYWQEFAQELFAAGIRPDYLILDMELGIGFWHIPALQRRWFFGTIMDPQWSLRSILPEQMRNVTVDQLMDYQDRDGTLALNAYSQFAVEFRANFLHRVFSKAFESVYGERINISNYSDKLLEFETIGHTGRPSGFATTGGISAPVAYIEYRPRHNQRYRGTQKDQRWNRIIDALNRTRSTAGPGLVTPWIAAPGYWRNDGWVGENLIDREFGLFDILMDHMLAMGVDTFILWNPEPRFNPLAERADAYVDQWLADHPVASGPQLRDLPEIPLDSNSIETNGIVTTYEEFLEVMDR
jgi:hypothetical protein